ncbi:MAG: RecQ family ATP-dependent DNA helicase [Candidatus Hydrogenedentales bacterium]|jgi:ATP-dependent DNA helicase RecQ
MSTLELLKPIVKQYWGYDRFLPLQPEAMSCVMEGRDSVVILPTGGGKSLCFQAPAMAMPGMAVVVSPLISLMKDQVDALRANGVNAECINSGMTLTERRRVDERIRSGVLKLLYVSPERIVMPHFLEYLRAASPTFFVVDEAHCISQWGHDFRPEYRALRCLRETFPDVAMHAYTATATEHVRADIASALGLRDARVLIGSFDRPNLVYSVQRRLDGLSQVREVIDRHRGDSGIVYCIRRAEVDAMHTKLCIMGYKALPYHAGMGDADRTRNQEAFIREEADIIVATVAFGMGIDKSNVRYVAHMGMPKSIEHYQQESGRAGRDGLESECCLFHSGSDFLVWKSFIDKMEDTDAAAIALAKLNAVQSFCTGIVCRHQALVSYFGEQYTRMSCEACDVCLGNLDIVPEAEPIMQAILRAVDESGDIAGPTYTTQVLAGSREERILSKRHHKLASFGALASHPPRLIRDWIEQLVAQGCLEKCGMYNLLRVTPHARTEGVSPRLAKPAETRKKAAVSKAPVNSDLFEVLRRVRRERAEDLDVPPFVIFGDATLRDMARRLPRDTKEFLAVQGVGRAKCEAFGDVFLDAIREFCSMHEVSPDGSSETPPAPTPKKPNAPKAKKGDVQRRANELFARGLSLKEVAAEMGRALSTTEEYFVEYIQSQGISDASPWVSHEVFVRVRAAAGLSTDGRLRPIFEALNEEVSYAEIRVCMACLRNGA